MTELIWEGKYKENKKVTPVRIALPFQTIETLNETVTDRNKRLADLFNEKIETTWRNRLIWGDNKYVLASLLEEFAGKINLIYIDPPFFTGTNMNMNISVNNGKTESEFIKEPSIIEVVAYRNMWRDGADSFLKYMHERILIMHDLLANDGSIYVRFDYHYSHYIKIILDEIFGYENFTGELIINRSKIAREGVSLRRFATSCDSLFYYRKSTNNFIFNPVYKIRLKTPKWNEMHSPGQYKNNIERLIEGEKILPPIGRHWSFSQEKINNLLNENRVRLNSHKNYIDINRNKINFMIEYLESDNQPCDTNWSDIPGYSSTTGYPTENSEQVLERVIKASSNEGDLVADFFNGSGTTAAVAEKLNRRWIACDLGRFSIHTTRKRLLKIENVKPFIVQNLGKYERQQWLNAEFENVENRIQLEKSYKNFIIELYHGKTLNGYIWLHGTKAGRMVHVGTVEAPVTVEDIKQSIKEFWKLIGKDKNVDKNGIDFLGWDFAFDVNETAAQFAAENNVNVSFKKIPREVLEKKAVEQGDIKFYELAALKAKLQHDQKNKNKIKLTLENFIIPQDDLPEDVRGNITHWSQWIDYWAVDWNFKDDTFHNEWQNYRTKQNPKIEIFAEHEYSEKGKFTVVVKVIDILGNDTTKLLTIEVK